MIDGKKVVITYGTFDLFHYGHKALLERAKSLGDYLIVGVTSDAFDKSRGKLNVRQSLVDRIRSIEELGIADKIIVEEFRGQKIEDIRRYNVDIFAIGSDWTGKFDYINDYCEVVYLPRTQGISSTKLRNEAGTSIRLGCIGAGDFVERIIRECNYVSGIDVIAIADAVDAKIVATNDLNGFRTVSSFSEMAKLVDAVYICASSATRSRLVGEALKEGLHVMCEGPIAYSLNELKRLQDFASLSKLVLIEAHTVLHEPGFQRLQLLLESGAIGEIKDIDVSYSQAPSCLDYDNRWDGSFFNMSSRTLLPVLTFLGTNPCSAQLICGYDGDFCTWSKCNLAYKTATATCKTGRGVKTEGDMTITGTNGYIYVPAPWWRLEYFEIRGEDLRKTKKNYYECLGEGQRYLIKDFYTYCTNWKIYESLKDQLQNIEALTVGYIEKMNLGDCIRLENHRQKFGGGEQL